MKILINIIILLGLAFGGYLIYQKVEHDKDLSAEQGMVDLKATLIQEIKKIDIDELLSENKDDIVEYIKDNNIEVDLTDTDALNEKIDEILSSSKKDEFLEWLKNKK